jgi:hypothetical protein
LKHENAAGMQILLCHLTSTGGAAGTGGGLVGERREDSSITLLLLTGCCCCKQSTSPALLLVLVVPAKIVFKTMAQSYKTVNTMKLTNKKSVSLSFKTFCFLTFSNHQI